MALLWKWQSVSLEQIKVRLNYQAYHKYNELNLNLHAWIFPLISEGKVASPLRTRLRSADKGWEPLRETN